VMFEHELSILFLKFKNGWNVAAWVEEKW